MTSNKTRLMGGASFHNLGMGLMARGPMVTRGPEDDAGGGGTGDNSGGNPGAGGNESGGGNNAGTGFDPATFWNEPKPAAAGSPSGGSADSGGAGGGQQQQQDEGANSGKALAERINNLPFQPVFNQAVIDELNEGKLDGINNAIHGQLREASKQSLIMSAQLMQQFGTQLQGQMKQMIQEALGTRDNSDTLLKEFPSAKDPAVRPMIQGVFDQALKLSGGDRVKAVEATKEMLKHMGKTSASDMDISLPPANPADTYSNPSASRLVDELLGRS